MGGRGGDQGIPVLDVTLHHAQWIKFGMSNIIYFLPLDMHSPLSVIHAHECTDNTPPNGLIEKHITCLYMKFD